MRPPPPGGISGGRVSSLTPDMDALMSRGPGPWTSDGPPAPSSPRLVWPQTWHIALSHGHGPTPTVAMVTELQYLCKACFFLFFSPPDGRIGCMAFARRLCSHTLTDHADRSQLCPTGRRLAPLWSKSAHITGASYNEVILTPPYGGTPGLATKQHWILNPPTRTRTSVQ